MRCDSNRTRLLGRVLIALCLYTSSASVTMAFDADSDFNLAANFFRKQRWRYAADAFQAFLKDYPEHPRSSLAQLYLGMSLNSLEEFGPAREQFQAFIKNNPESRNMADAQYGLAECTYHLREYPLAIQQLTSYLQAQKGHNLNDWASLMLGESLNATEDWARAETVLQQLLQQGPNAKITADVTFALGIALQGSGKSEEALQTFQTVVDLNSDRFAHRALARIGTIHFTADEFQQASAAYDQIVSQFADKSIAHPAAVQSGISLFKLGKFADAISRLDRVPNDSEERVRALMWKGLCYRELGQLDQARTELAEAYTVSADTPVAADILFQRAQIEMLDNKRDVAAQMFLDLADRWPTAANVPDSLFNAAELQAEIGDVAASRSTLNRLRQLSQAEELQNKTVLLEGRLLLHEDKVAEAVTVLRKAVELPTYTQRERLLASYHLIRSLHRAGEFADVIAVFKPLESQFALPENSELTGAVALAAMSALELKQFDAAKEYAGEFLQINQTPEKAADALAVRAVAASQLKQFASAKEDLSRLISDFSNNAQTWMAVLQSAEAAWQQEDFTASADLFTLAIERKSDPKLHLSSLTGAAWSYYRLNKFAQAADLFRRAKTEYPEATAVVEASFMEARSKFDQGDKQTAAGLFQTLFDRLEVTSKDSGDEPDQYLFDAGAMHARLLTEFGKVDEADSVWERLARIHDKSTRLPSILDEWAFVNLQHERYSRADEIYTQLLDRFPDSEFAGQARLSLAESSMQANRLDLALREFLAISQDQRYEAAEKEAALYHAIDILAAQRRWSDVQMHARTFADLYSASELAPNVQLLHAEALLDQKQFAEATVKLSSLREAILENRLPSEPWTERTWVVLAEVALAEKQYDKIDQIADELQQRNPMSRFLFQMRDVQGRQWKSQAPPDFQKSRSYFAMVTTDDVGKGTETAARCQFLIAETFLLEGKHEAALKEYYRVYLNYAFDDWRARGLFQAAGCEARLGRIKEATRSYEDLIREFPESDLVAQANEQLSELRKTAK